MKQMKIIDLIKNLAESYRDLNPTLLMRYVVGSNEMLVQNMIIGKESYLSRMLFEACYEADIKGENLGDHFKELIVSENEVQCIQIGDMYFAPSLFDGGSILFGKDLEIIKSSVSAIKGVNYKLRKV